MSFGKEWLELKHNKIPILFGRNAEMKKRGTRRWFNTSWENSYLGEKYQRWIWKEY